MDKEWVRRHLPEQPPKGLISWARKKHGQTELGGEFVIFKSTRVAGQKEWAAECTCTACHEDFITQKEPGMKAVRMICGEDGSYYTAEPWDEEAEPNEIIREGDEFYCPLCGSKVELIHAGALRGGRKKQIMILSVENIGPYTAILYWLVWRTVDEDGLSEYGATPEEAYVLAETGGLTRYSHVYRMGSFFGSNRSYLTEWKQMARNQDVIDKPYPDWRSINTRKAGADIYPEMPDLEGTTGEKTALEEFIKANGYRIIEYLKWWRQRPSIENLCRQGQAGLVVQIVQRAWRFSYSVALEGEKYIDARKKKPHEMLGMTKEEFRYLKRNGISWSIEEAENLRKYRQYGGQLGLVAFYEMAKEYGAGLNAALELMHLYADADLDKLARYLKKNGLALREARILLDTRNNTKKLYGRELTSEELWPRQLHEAHDRVNRMLLERKCQAEAEKLKKGFDGILKAYGHLQWTDGDLEVLLPRHNGELVYEGDVLRHCVGGYGSAHCEGRSVIFFIRHHRRPERPYYTLAIDMTGLPVEKQLHGYGNERHGAHKQYSHSIPKKVRSFCDRWKDEVLMAWYAETQKQKKEKSA